MTIKEAKAIDMVAYLSMIGLEPAKVQGVNYWYYSPFRSEKTPSFKINRRRNQWYDFGEGKGGNLLDFVLLLDNVNIPEALKLIAQGVPLSTAPIILPPDPPSIEILSAVSIRSLALIRYCQSRRIPALLADQYLKQVYYKNGYKTFYALGFKNDAGGYELRAANFKGSSHPKSPTWFKNGADVLAVFEGFFDFLSYMAINVNQCIPARDFLILNSTSFFVRACQICRHIKQSISTWTMTPPAVSIPHWLFMCRRFNSLTGAIYIWATMILTTGISILGWRPTRTGSPVIAEYR
jgi:hypothetical protein